MRLKKNDIEIFCLWDDGSKPVSTPSLTKN